MAFQGIFLVASLLLSCLAATCYAAVSFSSLPNTLVVSVSTTEGQVLKAGEDQITVTWSLKASLPAGTDSSSYSNVKVKLCYAPISQRDQAWRRTEDSLEKDKTCQHKIVARAYSASNNSFTWTVQKDIPTATYFVRAYVHDSHDHQVAYGQSTDSDKATNLFGVQAISGRHASLDIASVCFSAFSVVSLFVFFFMEKRKAKASAQK